MTTFNPSSDIPELSGKVIIVTGGNNGLGKETIKQLAHHNPARLYLAARSKTKYDDAIADLMNDGVPTSSIAFLALDLASLHSVSEAARQVIADNDRLDFLINNAGIMGALPAVTEDGYEVHFGTNHIGHAYFTRLLLPLMTRTAKMSNNTNQVRNC